MMRAAVVATLLFVLTACAGIKEKDALQSIEGMDPMSLPRGFGQALPSKAEVLSSIMFEFNIVGKVSALGSVSIDRETGKFIVVCLSPLGVKLLELTGTPEEIRTDYVLPQLAKAGDIGNAVGGDIRRIYFDLVPRQDARVEALPDRAIFKESDGKGAETWLTYAAAGGGQGDQASTEGRLIEKKRYDKSDLSWKITYSGWRAVDGSLFPEGVFLLNYQYGYSLTVKLKDARLY